MVQSGAKIDFWSVLFEVRFKRVVGSVFDVFVEFLGVLGGYENLVL